MSDRQFGLAANWSLSAMWWRVVADAPVSQEREDRADGNMVAKAAVWIVYREILGNSETIHRGNERQLHSVMGNEKLSADLARWRGAMYICFPILVDDVIEEHGFSDVPWLAWIVADWSRNYPGQSYLLMPPEKVINLACETTHR